MNIELENVYDKWDDSLKQAEGYIFNSIPELFECFEYRVPSRVHPSDLENHPFSTGESGSKARMYFYKVRDVKDEDKGYIIHTEFEPELVGKAGVFCDNLEDIEALIDPVNFVPLALRSKGTTSFPFFTGKIYYKYFIEIPSLTAFPDDICPLQPGDIIREKLGTIKYMIIGIDEDQCSAHHVLISNSWLDNEALFNKFYKVTEHGDSVIGVMRQSEIV